MEQELRHHHQPDHSALQVVEFDETPEACYRPDYSLPQATPFDKAPEVCGHTAPEPVPLSAGPLQELEKQPSEGGEDGSLTPRVQSWWRRKRCLACITFATILGAVLGGVLGRREVFEKPVATSSNTTQPQARIESFCRGEVCPQILAAAQLPSQDEWDLDVMLFARGIDNDIWRTFVPVTGPLSPQEDRVWKKLNGGPFLSQPSALIWSNSTRLSVAAVSDPDHTVKALLYSHIERDSATHVPWTSLSGPATSALAMCTVNGTRLDLWTASGRNFAHNLWQGNLTADIFWSPDVQPRWQLTRDFGMDISGRPAIACRRDTYYHDLVVRGLDGAVRHSTFKDGTGWTAVSNRGGNLRGEPVVVAAGDDRFDFFGVGAGKDAAMFHFTWTKPGGYTAMEKLGGSFQSVPSVVVTGPAENPRIDVVALGTDDMLWHGALVGSKWWAHWERLDVFGNSAPLLTKIEVPPPWSPMVAAFVLGMDGQVNHTLWNVSSEFSWRGLTWTSIGGNLTAEYYRS